MIENTSIENHLILVTGAASGIGRQIAIDLSSRGANVAACDKNLEALQELATQYPMSVYEVDFVDEKSIMDLVTKVESNQGPLSAAINCVGILNINAEKNPLSSILINSY